MRVLCSYLCFLVCLFFISDIGYSQVSDLKHIPTKYKDVKESAVLAIDDQELLFFFSNSAGDSIFSIRTTDLGNTWQPESFVQKTKPKHLSQESLYLNAIKASNNRIILSWTIYRDSITVLRSDDNGYSWLSPLKFRAGNNSSPVLGTALGLNISNSVSGTLILTFANSTSCWFRKSYNNGDTWSDSTFAIYAPTNKVASLVAINDLVLFAFLNQTENKIISIKSTDGGNTWSSPLTVVESDLVLKYPESIISDNGFLWLVYQKEYTHDFSYSIYGMVIPLKTNNLFYRTSTDQGITWQDEKQLTKYAGDDNNLNLSNYKDTPLINFTTQRFTNSYDLTYLVPGKFEEIKTPPYVHFYFPASIQDTIKNKLFYSAVVIDDDSVKNVSINYGDNKITGELFDDGLHYDNVAGDSLFANAFDIPRLDNYSDYLIRENNLKIPVKNNGVIAASGYPAINLNTLNGYFESRDIDNTITRIEGEFPINLIGYSGGRFDDVVFLFSSGFAISGLEGDSIWSNGVMSASLVVDYLPGNVGSDPKQPKNSIYVVKADDKPFGNSWQTWKDAVERGAEFYDGDNDGIYNPIDKNFNGIWDHEEDIPMILGDETVWCVYNDGLPDSLRRWRVPPKDIEIAQTIFTSKESGLENVMFLRYKILNKSFVDYDSVYFGFWADPDLGNATDDRVGCDTLLNSGFVYNDGSDEFEYGDNPPAFFTTVLQGPIIESGSNVDTAYNRLGELLGTRIFTSSKNSGISAHAMHIGGDPSFNDPNTPVAARNYLMGKTRLGENLDPCTLTYGQVLGGVNCNEVNNRLWFSGDPVTQVGWIETISSDVRNLLSTGPFKLKSNEPIDIIAAYVVGRGTDALNSITVTREIVEGVIQEYENNFPRLTYKPGTPTNPIVSYELYQNYPNPFNPTTTIRYAIPQDGIVTIKIFDVLGQQVATLKNEFQKANRYEVQFNSKGLASGVYIYKLQVNDYSESKKMMILR